MAEPTYAQRLLLPRTFAPQRALHVAEAEDDLAMLAAGLDLLVAQSPTTRLTAPGALLVGGVDGIASVLAPGQPGQILVLDANSLIVWADVPRELPAHAAGDNGKLLGLLGGAVVWMQPVTGIPDFEVADEGKRLGIASGKVAWLPLEIPAYTNAEVGKALVVNTAGGLEWGNSLPSATGATTGAVLSVLTGNKVGWTTISSLLPDIPAVLEGQVLSLIAGGGMAWATIPSQLPDFSGAVDGAMLHVHNGSLAWATQDMSDYIVNPMRSPYDLIMGGVAGKPERLIMGTSGQVLRVAATGDSVGWQDIREMPPYGVVNNGQALMITEGAPAWGVLPSYMTNPMNTVGDLIVGVVNGEPARLGKGAQGDMLAVLAGGLLGWVTPSFMANPLTTPGDVIYSGVNGLPIRLGIGSTGQVFTVVGGMPQWADPAASSSLPDYAALDGQILRVNAGALAWVSPSWMNNPMTTLHDMVVGGADGTPTRVPVGTSGQVWTVSPTGVPTWQDPAGGGVVVPDTITITTQSQTVPVGGTASWYEDIPGGFNRLYGVSVTPTTTLEAGTDATLRLFSDESAPSTFNTQAYKSEFTLNLQADTGQAWYYRDLKKTGRMRLSLTNAGTAPVTLAFTIVVEPF